jgi:beta-mannosidase
MDFEGKILLEENHTINIDPLSSRVQLDWPLKKLTDAGAADTSRVFVVATLTVDASIVSRNLTYLAPVKEVHLVPATLKSEIDQKGGRLAIRVASPALARSVYLSFGSLDVKLSDNYFDILPGETIEITADTKASLDELRSQLKVISLTDAFAMAPQAATVSAAH